MASENLAGRSFQKYDDGLTFAVHWPLNRESLTV